MGYFNNSKNEVEPYFMMIKRICMFSLPWFLHLFFYFVANELCRSVLVTWMIGFNFEL